MKYLLICGERSGDLHGSSLVTQIKIQDPEAKILAMGGDLMEKQGADLFVHYSEVSFMGFWEVIKNLGRIRKVLNTCKKKVLIENPDHLILIDFPGFNLRMARFAHEQGISVTYYIPPKVWAWKASRIKQLQQYVTHLYIIFPFEIAYYKERNVNARYYGNPLVHHLRNYNFRKPELPGSYRKVIAVLPGSRKQEVKAAQRVIIDLSRSRPGDLFVIAAVSNLPDDMYKGFTGIGNIIVLKDQTYDILYHADVAIVTSGTATLETALIGKPQVVCYRTSRLTYFLARAFIKVRFISLVNLLLDRPLIRELIQKEYHPDIISREIDRLTEDSDYKKGIKKGYQEIVKILGTQNPAQLITKDLVKQP
jgi:lipid-A-disaccharide synthase